MDLERFISSYPIVCKHFCNSDIPDDNISPRLDYDAKASEFGSRIFTDEGRVAPDFYLFQDHGVSIV